MCECVCVCVCVSHVFILCWVQLHIIRLNTLKTKFYYSSMSGLLSKQCNYSIT